MSALVHDNLDDRRTVHRLLQLLTARQRLAWMRWACQQASSKPQPEFVPEYGCSAMECFFQFWLLVQQYNVDADKALAELTKRVKKHGPRRSD